MNADRLEAAMSVALPSLPRPDDIGCWPPGSAERQELESRRGVARTRVYRVVAALNGFDVMAHAAPREGATAEPPVLVPRESFDRLREAVMNETVFAALAAVAGENEANTLLGEIAAL
jgi:hypothetical protein